MSDLWTRLARVVPQAYRRLVTQPEHLTVDQLAQQLSCTPGEALALVRRVGPRGVLRTTDSRFLVPVAVVEQLRAASTATA